MQMDVKNDQNDSLYMENLNESTILYEHTVQHNFDSAGNSLLEEQKKASSQVDMMRHHDETGNEEQQRFEESKGGSELASPTQQARFMGHPYSDRGMVLDQT